VRPSIQDPASYEKVSFAENDPVEHPISPSAAAKRAGELIAGTYYHLFGIDVACPRMFTVFGPRQGPDLVIRKFARLMAEGSEIELYGDGSSARDYTYLNDIVECIVPAARRVKGFQIWNLGGSRPVLLRDLVAGLASALGAEAKIQRLPAQPGHVQRRRLRCGETAGVVSAGRLGAGPPVPPEMRRGFTREPRDILLAQSYPCAANILAHSLSHVGRVEALAFRRQLQPQARPAGKLRRVVRCVGGYQ
jgi:hypothetical protein